LVTAGKNISAEPPRLYQEYLPQRRLVDPDEDMLCPSLCWKGGMPQLPFSLLLLDLASRLN
jgi:hypothetical protein